MLKLKEGKKMIIILCGLILISMIVFYLYWRGDITIEIPILLLFCLMFLGVFILVFDNINVRSRLDILNNFLVDNSDYVNNNSLKYYDKEREKSGDKLFTKNINYISKNKIQVSLSKFDDYTCKKIIKFTNSSSKVNRQLFKKEYTIKMNTLISDENVFCKNKDNKITYTIMIKTDNRKNK